jgi:hypothetical protein
MMMSMTSVSTIMTMMHWSTLKIDHIFSAQCYYFDGLQAIIPNLVFRPEYSFVNFPVILPVQPVILPDEPYPPGWITDQTILRGPPCKVNQLFS